MQRAGRGAGAFRHGGNARKCDQRPGGWCAGAAGSSLPLLPQWQLTTDLLPSLSPAACPLRPLNVLISHADGKYTGVRRLGAAGSKGPAGKNSGVTVTAAALPKHRPSLAAGCCEARNVSSPNDVSHGAAEVAKLVLKVTTPYVTAFLRVALIFYRSGMCDADHMQSRLPERRNAVVSVTAHRPLHAGSRPHATVIMSPCFRISRRPSMHSTARQPRRGWRWWHCCSARCLAWRPAFATACHKRSSWHPMHRFALQARRKLVDGGNPASPG